MRISGPSSFLISPLVDEFPLDDRRTLCDLGSHDSQNTSEYKRPGATATLTVRVSRSNSCANASADGGAEQFVSPVGRWKADFADVLSLESKSVRTKPSLGSGRANEVVVVYAHKDARYTVPS